MPVIYSIVESPGHPPLADHYQAAGFTEFRFAAMRKAIAELKSHPPDVVVADFMYGYGNNYAGVNISNLDVFLYSLQRYAPQAKVIVLVDKTERQYVDKLNDIVPLHAVLIYPVTAQSLLPYVTN